MLGPELVQLTKDAMQYVQKRLQTAQTSYRSYANVQRQPLEFEVKDFVFLKVSPSKGIARFRKQGKLNPQFIGPHHIIDREGVVTYQLELSYELAYMHSVFHVLDTSLVLFRFESHSGTETSGCQRRSHLC